MTTLLKNLSKAVILVSSGVMVVAMSGCIALKEPVSRRINGTWTGQITFSEISSANGVHRKAVLLVLEAYPEIDDTNLRSALVTRELILTEWKNVGIGDDKRRFRYLEDNGLKEGMRVGVKGQLLIGYLVDDGGAVYSISQVGEERLELLLRVKNVTILK